jgi:hypothetical protein
MRLQTLAMIGLAGLVLCGCENGNPGARAGAALDRAGTATGNALGRAANDTGKAISRAGNATGAALNRSGNYLDRKVGAVASD